MRAGQVTTSLKAGGGWPWGRFHPDVLHWGQAVVLLHIVYQVSLCILYKNSLDFDYVNQ